MDTFRSRIRIVVEPEVRRRLWVSVAIAIFLAIADALGVALLVPLLHAVQGDAPSSEPGGAVHRLLGAESAEEAATAIGLLAIGIFVAKDVLAIFFLRWSFGYLMRA